MSMVDTMMPCAAETPPIGVDDALVLGLQLSRLQRVNTYPGSHDLQFLKDIRGRHPSGMTDRQRAYVRQLAWRYRWQLPAMLRPKADPGIQDYQEANNG